MDCPTPRVVVNSSVSKWQVALHRGQYLHWQDLTSLLRTWTVGLRAPLASLLIVLLLEGRDGIQKELGRLESLVHMNFMKCNKTKVDFD